MGSKKSRKAHSSFYKTLLMTIPMTMYKQVLTEIMMMKKAKKMKKMMVTRRIRPTMKNRSRLTKRLKFKSIPKTLSRFRLPLRKIEMEKKIRNKSSRSREINLNKLKRILMLKLRIRLVSNSKINKTALEMRKVLIMIVGTLIKTRKIGKIQSSLRMGISKLRPRTLSCDPYAEYYIVYCKTITFA